MRKELNLFSVYTIATGATIASGFFLLPGLAYQQAGPAMVLSYLFASVPVFLALFSKAELATAMPRAGGVYYFLDRSMGPLFGTVGGIGTWLAIILKTTFALVGMGAYLSLYIPDVSMTPLAIAFAIIFSLINLAGARKSGLFQSVLVVALLGILAWFTGRGLVEIDLTHLHGFLDKGWDSVMATTGLVYVSYVGLTKVASVAEEVRNPERTIPLGMFLALGSALLIYAVCTTLMVVVVPADVLSGNLTPVAAAAREIMGEGGALIMSIAAILAFFSVANAGILSASRYPLAMSRDHLMPRIFTRMGKSGAPTTGILVTLGLIVVILVFFNPLKIAKLASAFQLLLFGLNCLAVIVMRESRIQSYDPGFRSPLYPWMQIAGMIVCFGLIGFMGWLPILFTVALIVACVLYYVYYARSRVTRDGAIYHIFARLGEQRFEGLDRELRGILKEKGVRDQDPYDEVITNAMIIDLPRAADFEAVVEKASAMLSEWVDTDHKVLVDGFMQGTRIGATPVSHGAALPHLRLANLRSPHVVIVRAREAVTVEVDPELFGEAGSRQAVHAFFFLVSQEENPGQHLRILAQIADHVDDDDFLPNWLAAANEQELKEILLREDRYISLGLESGAAVADWIGRRIEELPLPEGCLVALVHRDGNILVPRGRTVLLEHDRLTVIGTPGDIATLYRRYR